MSGVVFIPTRSRTHNIAKVLPKWEDQENIEHIFLVTEPDERKIYKRFVRDKLDMADYVSVISPRRGNIGIGATRKFIVDRAEMEGLDRIIISDDDAYPVADTDITKLCDDLEDLGSVGIGACFSFYGLMLGNDVLKKGRYSNKGKPYLVPGGMGYIMFSIDIQRATAAGNYDRRLHSFWEDAELVRDGMKELGYAWHVHTGAWATSIGKRFMPGGLMSDTDMKHRSLAEKECHKIVYKKWGPRYISHPDKKAICRWQNFLDDFVEDWRDRAVWLNK